MILRELLNGVDFTEIKGDDGIEVSGVSFNSNEVKDNYLFIALRGENTDGHKYIDSAIRNGAKALIVEKVADIDSEKISIVRVVDSRAALAVISANFFNRPTEELTLVGITGTNGKTTITYLLESIWNQEQKKSGVIGTIDYR